MSDNYEIKADPAGDYWLRRSDFGDSLEDWIAFTIAYTMNVSCRDKEALLHLLHETAKEIIEKVRKSPELGEVEDE